MMLSIATKYDAKYDAKYLKNCSILVFRVRFFPATRILPRIRILKKREHAPSMCASFQHNVGSPSVVPKTFVNYNRLLPILSS